MQRSQIPKYVMSTLCRICAEKSSKLTSIFETESLPIKICKCLPIQVKDSDYLPLKVCENCFFKINESYTLYIKADEADQRLKKLWKILIKETTVDNSKTVEEKKLAVIHNTQFPMIEEENVSCEMSLSHPVVNIPQEETYQRVESLANNNQLVCELSGDDIIITKAMSSEVNIESSVLKSPEKKHNMLQIKENQPKVLFESEEKSSNIEQVMSDTSKLYHCQYCPYQISSLASLSAHESTHLEERPYLCDTCGKSFKNAKYLRSHARTHSAVRKKYVCELCSKGFITNFFLREHMNTHTGETPYKCEICEKEFREKVHLRQHKWTHSTQKFTCPICRSKFNRKGNMTEHVKQFHKNEDTVKQKISPNKSEESSSIENTNFKCPACNSEFDNQFVFNNHLKIHPEQKRFCCSVCGKKFRHSGSLTYHRRSAHTGERPFQCSYCDQKFSLRSVQTIHERKYHTFENPYKCAFCSRSFTNSSSLRNHLYVHSKEKMFKCEECGKKFSRSSNLIIHKKLHSGDRKFSCDQCGKNYIQKHDLLKHRKVHDPKSKPFFCKYCGNSFSRKKDSVKHAMCQFDFLRKNNPVTYSAEKILDSVTNSLKKAGREFTIEEEQQLILESVEELSRGETEIIYGDA